MKTILITGINGFLGSHLAMALVNEYRVIGLEHKSSSLDRIKETDVKVYSSVSDIATNFKEEGIWGIIHTATIYRRNQSDPVDSLIQTNIALPVKLMELAESNNCELFINTDTFFNNPSYNYAYLPDYTLSKKQALEWMKLISRNCKLINLKLHHMYGPGDNPDKFIPQIASALKSNIPFLDLSLGEQKRDFIFIDDVVDAFKTVLDRVSTKSNSFLELEVGTGISTSIRELVQTMKSISKSNTELKFGAFPYRDGEIMEAKADNRSLAQIGWSPTVLLETGIIKIIAAL